MSDKRVIILGITGMLGHTLFRRLSRCIGLAVYGTARSAKGFSRWFPNVHPEQVKTGVHAEDFDSITQSVADIQPDIVINAIGIIKQVPAAKDPLKAIAINALLPHRIALVCKMTNARLIHVSTDCVFSGNKGGYAENDIADAPDLYGRTKLLGEVTYPHCITLRTSIIGHELRGEHGLVEWFLAREGKVRGFTNAVFSGLPTVELARVIAEYVIPSKDLNGLYHVSSSPISKYDLLKLIADCYRLPITIEPVETPSYDKTLNSTRFRRATGYQPPGWPKLIDAMYGDYTSVPHHTQKNRGE